MPELKTSLTAEEHAGLPEAERGFYKQVGTSFVPNIAGIENLPGYETVLAAERKKATDLEKALKPYTDAGVTPERLAELIKLEQSQQVGKHVDKGEYQKAKELAEQQADQRATAAEQRAADKIITSQLTLALVRAGVIPERLEDALEVTRKMVRLAKDDSLEVIGKDGNPTGQEFEKFVSNDLKTQKPWYYAPANVSGTGGENGTNGLNAGVDLSKLSAVERLKVANKQQAAAAK